MARKFMNYNYPIIPVSGSTGIYTSDPSALGATPLALLYNFGLNAKDLHVETYDANGKIDDRVLAKAFATPCLLEYIQAVNLDGVAMYLDMSTINLSLYDGYLRPAINSDDRHMITWYHNERVTYHVSALSGTFDTQSDATVGRALPFETSIRTAITNDLANQGRTTYDVPGYNIVRNDRAEDWTPIYFHRYPSLFAGARANTTTSGTTRSNVTINQYDNYIKINLIIPCQVQLLQYYYKNYNNEQLDLGLKSSLNIPNQPATNAVLELGVKNNTIANANRKYWYAPFDAAGDTGQSVFRDYNGNTYECSDGDYLESYSMVDYITYSTVNVAKPTLSIIGNKLSWSITNNNNVKYNVKYKVYRDDSLITTTSSTTYTISTSNSSNYGAHTWKVEVVPSSLSMITNTAFYSGDNESVPYLNKVQLEIPRVTSSNKYSDPVTSYITANNNVTAESLNVPDGQKIHVTSDGGNYYKYQLDNGSWSGYIPIASDTTFTNLSYGNHTVKVKIYVDNQGHGESSVIDKPFILISLIAPSGLSFDRRSVDGGIFTYILLQNNLPANSYKFKIRINNGAWVDNGNNTSYNISGGILNTNRADVRIEYYNNGVHKSDFDSTASTTFELPKLITPQAIGLENYNTNGGVRYIKMQWGAVQYAVDYVIRDTVEYTDPNTQEIVSVTNTYDNSGDDGLSLLIFGGSEAGLTGASLTQFGLHRFTVQARALGTGTSVFDSVWSEVGPNLEFEIHVLKAPVIAWKSASTGLLSQQSTLMWATPTDPDDEDNIPDYYIVHLDNLLSQSIINNTDNGMEYNIADTILQTPTETHTYNVNVYPYSYNTLYYQTASTSISNDLTYNVIKLATPTNVSYDIDHQTISWDNITNANIYYVYEINENNLSILWGTSDTNSFEFDTPLDDGLHYFYVVAGKITYEED